MLCIGHSTEETVTTGRSHEPDCSYAKKHPFVLQVLIEFSVLCFYVHTHHSVCFRSQKRIFLTVYTKHNVTPGSIESDANTVLDYPDLMALNNNTINTH